MIAMGAVAIVMLFVEIEGIHIDAKGQGWSGRPVSSVATTPAKPPSNAGSAALRRALFAARSKARASVSSSGSPIRLSASMTSRPSAS